MTIVESVAAPTAAKPERLASGVLSNFGRTPWVAFLVYLGLALGLTYVFGWNTEPVTFFGEIAGDRTIGERVGSIVADAE